MFNVISTTCGMLDHDIARAYKKYYHGAFELDDIELGEHSLMRLGNVIVPNNRILSICRQRFHGHRGVKQYGFLPLINVRLLPIVDGNMHGQQHIQWVYTADQCVTYRLR